MSSHPAQKSGPVGYRLEAYSMYITQKFCRESLPSWGKVHRFSTFLSIKVYQSLTLTRIYFVGAFIEVYSTTRFLPELTYIVIAEASWLRHL